MSLAYFRSEVSMIYYFAFTFTKQLLFAEYATMFVKPTQVLLQLVKIFSVLQLEPVPVSTPGTKSSSFNHFSAPPNALKRGYQRAIAHKTDSIMG